MTTIERLMSAIVDMQHYITHDVDPDKCAACPRWDELQSAAVAAADEIERLRKGIAAVSALIADSSGVCGLHLNGDPAPWDELFSGGQFEEWLADFDAARGES